MHEPTFYPAIFRPNGTGNGRALTVREVAALNDGDPIVVVGDGLESDISGVVYAVVPGSAPSLSATEDGTVFYFAHIRRPNGSYDEFICEATYADDDAFATMLVDLGFSER